MKIEEYLQGLGISFIEHRHSPVFTVEQAQNDPIHASIQGIHSKNLLLKNRKSSRFFLVVMPYDQPFSISDFEKIVSEKVKFANEKDLKGLLGVIPGAVSPLGLVNDEKHVVELFIDGKIWNSDIVSFHPNDNTRTLELKREDFHRYICSMQNRTKIIHL